MILHIFLSTLNFYVFFRFSKDIDVQQKWLKMLHRKEGNLKKKSTVCRKHFEPKCFTHGVSPTVKGCFGSVPTLPMPVCYL